MTVDDLPQARILQHAERWNQTPADWHLFLTSNPEGCFVAVAEVAGAQTVVGTITSIRYGRESCWISMLLVDRRMRGQGIARTLMQRAIAANQDVCGSIRLDATPAGRPVYEKLGFRVDYELHRWMSPRVPKVEVPECCSSLVLSDLAGVLAMDRTVFGGDREQVLSYLLESFPEGAWLCGLDPQTHAYVLSRRGEHYHYIGPLVAGNESIAVHLLNAAMAQAPAGPVAMDLPARMGSPFRRVVEDAGFEFQRPFTRMTLGAQAREQPEMVMAIAGPEFG